MRSSMKMLRGNCPVYRICSILSPVLQTPTARPCIASPQWGSVVAGQHFVIARRRVLMHQSSSLSSPRCPALSLISAGMEVAWVEWAYFSHHLYVYSLIIALLPINAKLNGIPGNTIPAEVTIATEQYDNCHNWILNNPAQYVMLILPYRMLRMQSTSFLVPSR